MVGREFVQTVLDSLALSRVEHGESVNLVNNDAFHGIGRRCSCMYKRPVCTGLARRGNVDVMRRANLTDMVHPARRSGEIPPLRQAVAAMRTVGRTRREQLVVASHRGIVGPFKVRE